MKLEDQVTSLDISNKLKELGVKQESLFYWANTQSQDYKLRYFDMSRFREIDKISAFTVAELGKLLPDYVFSQRLDGNRGWICSEDNETDLNQYVEDCKEEADARGKMLIRLIEKGIIKEAYCDR